MLQIESVHKQFATKSIQGCLGTFAAGNTRGLVGPNGIGKTTLFKMILGEESPDEGTIRKRPRLRIGYLPQELETITGKTVLDATHRDLYPEHEAKRILSGSGSSSTISVAQSKTSPADIACGWHWRICFFRIPTC